MKNDIHFVQSEIELEPGVGAGQGGLEAQVHESLRLAIGQVHDFFKTASAEDSAKVFCEKPDGFAQAVWTLEKLSKCVLELRVSRESNVPEKHGHSNAGSARAAGLSPGTMREIQQFIEGFD